jgi:hypothetical protein
MAMQDWIAKYPGVRALLQQPGDVLVKAVAAETSPRRVLPPHIEVFWHPASDADVCAAVERGVPVIEECVTQRPAPMCLCGRYDLTWETA